MAKGSHIAALYYFVVFCFCSHCFHLKRNASTVQTMRTYGKYGISPVRATGKTHIPNATCRRDEIAMAIISTTTTKAMPFVSTTVTFVGKVHVCVSGDLQTHVQKHRYEDFVFLQMCTLRQRLVCRQRLSQSFRQAQQQKKLIEKAGAEDAPLL